MAMDPMHDSGKTRDIYCDKCRAHLDLAFKDFDGDVLGVHISLADLPVLLCPSCGETYLPDRSRAALLHTHRNAEAQGSRNVTGRRKKTNKDFGRTIVKFLYDSDDYDYIPGLSRPFDEGFLTPVFFNKEVLIKYDAHPSYQVSFASRTYGTINEGAFYLSFGINRNGLVVMWLGDIAQLPDNEQYYLRSENVPSDHSIGSEFYDGQIEIQYTDRTPEDKAFEQRSKFLEACFTRFGRKVAHLEKEVLDLAVSIRRPVVDTLDERRRVADVLNKVYLESLDNKALADLLSARGHDAGKLGSLKRLQKLLESVLPAVPVSETMRPLYVLYDLRVAYSHLGSDAGREKTLAFIRERLGLRQDAGFFAIYDALIAKMETGLGALAEALKSEKLASATS